jgi:hypothetical protein
LVNGFSDVGTELANDEADGEPNCDGLKNAGEAVFAVGAVGDEKAPPKSNPPGLGTDPNGFGSDAVAVDTENDPVAVADDFGVPPKLPNPPATDVAPNGFCSDVVAVVPEKSPDDSGNDIGASPNRLVPPATGTAPNGFGSDAVLVDPENNEDCSAVDGFGPPPGPIPPGVGVGGTRGAPCAVNGTSDDFVDSALKAGIGVVLAENPKAVRTGKGDGLCNELAGGTAKGDEVGAKPADVAKGRDGGCDVPSVTAAIKG